MAYPDFAAGQTLTAADLAAMQVQTVEQAEDQTVNNSTTLVNTNLAFVATSGATYRYTLLVSYTSASATADIKFAWTVPTGGTMNRYPQAGGAGSTGSAEDLTNMVSRRASATSVVAAAGTTTTPTTLAYIEEGEIFGGSVTGAFTLQFAQNTAAAVDTIVQSQSVLSYVRTD